MKNLFLSLLLIAGAQIASAQDKIYTTTQKAPIEGEVTEISVAEIKYKPTGRPFPVTTLDKQDVVKIVYANGEVFMVNNPLKDFAVYGDQRRWNAKLDLFSPLLGYTNLFLEHSVKPGRSIEYQLDLIGLGKDQYINYPNYNGTSYPDAKFGARGIGLGYGIKFLRLPDYVNGQVRLRHILQGSYLKPAISAAYYSRNFIGSDLFGVPTLQRKPVFDINPNITFGRQFILDNTISLELYGTIGYSVDNVRATDKSVQNDRTGPTYISDDSSPFNAFGYTRFSSGDFGLTLNGGIRVGYLFNVKKKAAAKK
jgi:hypothetical protein